MSVFRVNRTRDYTTISNHHLRNKNLSLKAKGLLTVMLSLPDDWNYSIGGLVKISLENESAIKSTLDELKKNGYLRITKLPPSVTESGRFEYVYDVFESPYREKQEVEKQGVENLPLENLPLENLAVENHTVYKYTNKSNTNNQLTKGRNTNDIGASPKKPSYDYSFFQSVYNEVCTKLPTCKVITEKRKTSIRTFLEDFTTDQWREICEKANANDFLTGKNERKWKAGIDFLLNTGKAAKVLEGTYGKQEEKETHHYGTYY